MKTQSNYIIELTKTKFQIINQTDHDEGRLRRGVFVEVVEVVVVEDDGRAVKLTAGIEDASVGKSKMETSVV
jgi:hypothetical protein